MLKIELGKRYVRRDGIVTNPIEYNRDDQGLFYKYRYDTSDPKSFGSVGENGNYWSNGTESPGDLIEEYMEEDVKRPKLVAGFRYVTRGGSITDPLKSDPLEKNKFTGMAEGVNIVWDLYGNVSCGRHGFAIVKEYISESIFPLQIGKQYITLDGSITEPLKGNDTGSKPYYYAKIVGTDKVWNWWPDGDFIGSDRTHHYTIVAIHKDVEVKKTSKKKEKKKPIRYNNLKFLEAWELARDTKKRYRFKGQEWLEFPNVKIIKEQFVQHEWEVEQ